MSRESSDHKIQSDKKTVAGYIKTLSSSEQAQAKILLRIFKEATNMRPVMWGKMVGYGTYHYRYESGREGDFFAAGFSLRKSGPTVYIIPGYQDYGRILEKLGPHKLGKSCLYLKTIDDIDTRVLKRLIRAGLKDLNKKYPVQRT